METEFTLPCDMSEDVTNFWYDDGYLFSRINEGAGNRHYLEDVVAFQEWLGEIIKRAAVESFAEIITKEEKTNG